jgi:hypothetical protein
MQAWYDIGNAYHYIIHSHLLLHQNNHYMYVDTINACTYNCKLVNISIIKY